MARRFRTLLLAGAVLLVSCAAANAAPRGTATGAAKAEAPPPVPVLGPDTSIEVPASDWLELLPIVIPERDGLYQRKDWFRKGGNLVATPSQDNTSVLTIPVIPRGSYQVEVKFMTASATGYVYIALPCGTSSVALALCDRASKSAYDAARQDGTQPLQGFSGLEAIEGKSADANNTGRQLSLQPKEVHTVQATVERDDDRRTVVITATLDGKQILRWSGKQELLFAVYQRHKQHIALASRHVTVSFSSVRLKMLSGAKAYAELPSKQREPVKAGKGRIKIRRVGPR
ncbi:MAG TPA: hypothetical protein VM238_15465 [Phycisphaerae bacterium]|nr:hypothetical protein [Phycisphaerae bacterium]